jgi:uncharacterized membrane protein (UPF0127 family)
MGPIRRHTTQFFFAAASLLLLSGFRRTADRFIPVYLPDGKLITAELAVTDEERAQGLMFRERLDPGQGMLFVFDEEGLYSFWMKNTKISLDLLWLDRSRTIVHLEPNVPPCLADPCPTYSTRIPALYVLELKSGAAAEHHLRLQDKLEFFLPAWLKKSR